MTARKPAAGRGARAKAGAKARAKRVPPTGPEAVIALGLEHRLGKVSSWNRFQRLGPYSTGLGRMQQWVTAYTEGVLEPDGDGAADPPGFVPS